MKKIQALAIGIIVIFVGGILVANAYINYYDAPYTTVPKDMVRTISCFIEKGKFVAANIYQNSEWTNPETEGKYYDILEDGSPGLYAILNITNQQGNSTAFIITYKLSGAILTFYYIELSDNTNALNVTSVVDQNGMYRTDLMGEEGIACGETLTSGMYTFSLIGPGVPGGANRESPPARFEVYIGTVARVYPYIYLLPTGIALIIGGLGIPILTTLKENKKGILSKRRKHLPRKPINKS